MGGGIYCTSSEAVRSMRLTHRSTWLDTKTPVVEEVIGRWHATEIDHDHVRIDNWRAMEQLA